MSARLVLFMAVSCLVVSGCLTGNNGDDLDINRGDSGYYVVEPVSVMSGSDASLRALVKGSIYETGEYMSVFGTCLDENSDFVPNTTAVFSAWYPNGTLFINQTNMTVLQPGYFLHQSYMSAVEGTYLTEMLCFANVSGVYMTAAAWGEWQNPYWVKRIGLLNDSISNLSIQIGNLSFVIDDSFNITWDLLNSLNFSMNQSFTYLNESVYYVASVANSSVDRNDSYLALLLQNITNCCTAPSGSLNYTDVHDAPVYQKKWKIRVTAYDGATRVEYPDAVCSISTSRTSPAVSMTPDGSTFVYYELVTTLTDWSWTVNCSYG